QPVFHFARRHQHLAWRATAGTEMAIIKNERGITGSNEGFGKGRQTGIARCGKTVAHDNARHVAFRVGRAVKVTTTGDAVAFKGNIVAHRHVALLVYGNAACRSWPCQRMKLDQTISKD